MMDEKGYCENVASELMEWKAKIDDIVMKFDRTATGDKSPVVSYVNDLHIFLDEINDRIDLLKTNCPVALSAEDREKIPESHFQKEWKTTWDDVSPGQIGG
jgi:hypothetical protein